MLSDSKGPRTVGESTMSATYVAVGLLLVVATVDLPWTTLWLNGRKEILLLASRRREMQSSVRSYLDVLDASGVVGFDASVPPEPDLDILRKAGVPAVFDEEFAAALDDYADHRRVLRSRLVKSE